MSDQIKKLTLEILREETKAGAEFTRSVRDGTYQAPRLVERDGLRVDSSYIPPATKREYRP